MGKFQFTIKELNYFWSQFECMRYIEQVFKGKNDWWRYVLSLITIFFGWQVLGVLPIFFVALNKSENLEDLMASSENMFVDLGIDSNLYLFVMLLTFIIGLIFLLVSVKYIHRRSLSSLVTSRQRVDWKRVGYAFLLWFLISLISLGIDYAISPEHYIYNFKPESFVILLLIAVVFMPLQTSFEELLFRGYLMQGLGGMFKNAAVPFLFTSIMFGLMHSFNPEVEKLGYAILLYYIGTGFLFGIVTLMDEGTELALGLHAANNIVAALFVTMNWSAFQTDALFIDISEPSLSLYMFLPVFIIYPLLILHFSRKYSWTDWKKRLFGKVEKPDLLDEY